MQIDPRSEYRVPVASRRDEPSPITPKRFENLSISGAFNNDVGCVGGSGECVGGSDINNDGTRMFLQSTLVMSY